MLLSLLTIGANSAMMLKQAIRQGNPNAIEFLISQQKDLRSSPLLLKKIMEMAVRQNDVRTVRMLRDKVRLESLFQFN